MVWNRRSTKDKLHPGKNNPVEEWVVSAEPTHPGIITIEDFVAAQNVAASRRRSRADATPAKPNTHRQTRRALTTFFNSRVFGTDRVQLATTSATVAVAAQHSYQEHQATMTSTRQALDDLAARQRRLARILEDNDDADGGLYRQTQERFQELAAEQAALASRLADLEATRPAAGADDVTLLNKLPQLEVDLAALPVDRLRPSLCAKI